MNTSHPDCTRGISTHPHAVKWFTSLALLLLTGYSAHAGPAVEIAKRWVGFGPLAKKQADLAPAALTRIPDQLVVDGVKFKPQMVTAYDGIANLSGVTEGEIGSSAYVFIAIRSDADGDFTLGLGADYFMTAYLNGEVVLDTWETGNVNHFGGLWPPHHGNFTPTVKLKKGMNVLAIRFGRGGGSATLVVGPAPENPKDMGTTWILDKPPLFEGLIAHDDYPFDISAVTWNYSWRNTSYVAGISPAMHNYALMYGKPYTLEKIFANAAKHRIPPILHINYLVEDPVRALGGNLIEWVDENDFGLWVTGNYLNTKGFGIGMYKDKEMYLKVLERHKGRIWSIFFGDEVVYHKKFFALAALSGDLSDTYIRGRDRGRIAKYKESIAANREMLDRTRAEIKEKYGFGKFDLPSSHNTTDEPYRWIAFNRWLHSELLNAQKQLWEIANESEKRFGYRPVVMGNDNRGPAMVHRVSRFAEYTDIVSTQSHGQQDGRWGQPVTYAVKVLADLSGKSVWPCVHIDTHGGIETAEQANEHLSQAIRGGGNGFLYWDRDIKGHSRGYMDTGTDMFGHPGRYAVFTNAVKLTRKIGALRRPDPDFAIFISNDTVTSRPLPVLSHDSRAVFNLLGPNAETWFKYISDTQVIDGKVKLTDWDTIVLVDNKYQRKEVSEQFIDYPRDGRTLVAMTPEVFMNGIDGSDTTHIAREVFGVRVGRKKQSDELIIRQATPLLPGYKPGDRLPIMQEYAGHSIEIEPGVKVIATFSDGTPAMTVKSHPGGGRGIYCAFTWNLRNMNVSNWRDFARSFAKGLDFKLDHDIWRFQFPMPEEAKAPPSYDNGEPVALTANNFHWWENRPLIRGNASDAGGRYRYSVAPDAPPEQHAAKEGWHRFRDGDLTDRLDAIEGPNFVSPRGTVLKKIRSGRLSTNRYTVGWKTTQAIEIEFDLGRQATLTEARLVFQGSLPGVTLLGASKQANYEVLGEGKGMSSPDVPELVVKAKPTKVRYVKVRIPARGEGETLKLAEITLWGHPK